MGIKELIGMETDRKVRYAIVGLGDIAQEDMMPAVEHTGNSKITALVTSDRLKAQELGQRGMTLAIAGVKPGSLQ